MALNIANHLGATRPIVLTFGNETSNAVISEDRFTGAYMRDLQEKAEADEIAGAEVFAHFLSDIIVEWDVMNGDAPLGTDFDTLNALPVRLQRGLFEAVMEAAGKEQTPQPGSRKRR